MLSRAIFFFSCDWEMICEESRQQVEELRGGNRRAPSSPLFCWPSEPSEGGTGPHAKKKRQAWRFLGFLIFSVSSDIGQASVLHSASLLGRTKLPPCPRRVNGRSQEECSHLFQPPWLRGEWQLSLETSYPYQDAKNRKL